MEYSCRSFYVGEERFTPIGWFRENAEDYWNYGIPEEKHLKVRLIGVQRCTWVNQTTEFEFDETGLFNCGYDTTFKIIVGLLEDSEMEYYNEYCVPEDKDLADWFCRAQGFYKSEWKWLEI